MVKENKLLDTASAFSGNRIYPACPLLSQEPQAVRGKKKKVGFFILKLSNKFKNVRDLET